MIATITPIRRCALCGELARPVDIEFQGAVVAEVSACDACIEQTEAELAQVRPVFRAMLDVGVPHEIADETMTYLLSRMHPPRPR